MNNGLRVLGVLVLVVLGGCSLLGLGEDAADVEGSFAGTFSGENCVGPLETGTFELEIDQVRDDLAGIWYMSGSLGGTISGRVQGDRIEELTLEGLRGEFHATGDAVISDDGNRIAGRFFGDDPVESCPTQIAFDVVRPPLVATGSLRQALRLLSAR